MKDSPNVFERKVEEQPIEQRKPLHQSDLVPGIIKTRHQGEANKYVYCGLDADKPSGHQVGNSTTIFFALDTFKLYVYTGSVWKSTTLA